MKNRNIKLFLTADLCSQFGAGMIIAALGWCALDKSGSNQLVAAITSINIIAGIFTSFFASLIIDIFPKKNITIFSHLLRSLFVVVPLTLLFINGYNSSLLLLIALSNGLGWNLYYPASKGLLQEISSDEELVKTNSGAEITMQIGLFSSGALAGSLYKLWGFNVILLIALILFVISLTLTSFIKVNNLKTNLKQKNGMLNVYIEGLRYFQKHPTIFWLGLVLYIPFIGAGLINTILPGYSVTNLNADSIVYGLIDMAYGIGACVVGFTIIGLTKKLSTNKIIVIGFLLGAVTGLILYANTSKLIAGLMFFICGLCGPGIRSLIFSLIMKHVPNEVLGRAMTTWNLISLVIQVTVTFLLGKIMDFISPAWGFLIYSLIILSGLVLFLSIMNKVGEYKKIFSDQPTQLTSNK